jgi:uncharacterized OsmC-like protein
MANKVTVIFDQLDGTIDNGTHQAPISIDGNAVSPYDYFLSGYAGCLHATFISILNKRRIEFGLITYNIEARKRDESPTVINYIETIVTINDVEERHHEKVKKSFEQAEQYCSISETIRRLDPIIKSDIIFK